MATATSPAAEPSNSKLSAPLRRFRLLDAMILVAATAVACVLMVGMERASDGAISWSAVPELFTDYAHQPEITIDNHIYWTDVCLGTGVLLFLLTLPFFVVYTLVLIPVRLLSPRPRLRRLADQPGFRVAVAFGLSILFLVIYAIIPVMFKGWGFWAEVAPDPSVCLIAIPAFPGLAISASWLSSLIGVRWRPERSWVDRLGRILGVYWIAQSIAWAFILPFNLGS
jgi:F0F1-type ATP synthase membrane subunit a